MAVVNFTTIPWETETANRQKESHIFFELRPCTNNIVYDRFEVCRNFSVRFNESLLGFRTRRIVGKYIYLSPSFSARCRIG